jgi:hypothetical protein
MIIHNTQMFGSTFTKVEEKTFFSYRKKSIEEKKLKK